MNPAKMVFFPANQDAKATMSADMITLKVKSISTLIHDYISFYTKEEPSATYLIAEGCE